MAPGRSARSFAGVRARRVAHGLRDPSVRQLWTADEVRLLGKAPDSDVAAQLGRTVGAVKTQRKSLKVPAWQGK